MWGKRRLDENSMQARVRVQPRHKRQQLGFSSCLRQNMRLRKNIQFAAGLFLSADVHLRGRVLADAHEGQTRLHAARLQCQNAVGDLLLQLAGDGPSINEIRRGHYSTTSIF